MKLLRFLLFPFTIIYIIITTLRNWFFDFGVFKSTEFDLPVIVVGNLSVGGTGKTPQVEYLVKLLKGKKKLAILSRGYKRKTKGYIQLKDDHNALDVGDEPLQYYQKFGKDISVAVDADRVNGVRTLINTVNPDLILLDDAFQHRKLKGSFYVLLTKFDDLFIDDYVLPVGNLRECRSGAKRADVIVVTKCPENLAMPEMLKITDRFDLGSKQKLFFSSIRYNHMLKGNEMPLSDLIGKDVVLVTGIANPSPLLTYLKKYNIEFMHLKYPDHHSFTEKDYKEIEDLSTNKIILTTEKDYVRLQHRITALSYIQIETFILNNEVKFTDLFS